MNTVSSESGSHNLRHNILIGVLCRRCGVTASYTE